MIILNIHGYRGDPQNAAYFGVLKNGYDVHTMPLDYDSALPFEMLSHLRDEYEKNGCSAIVGTSLGGFFATVLSAEKQCRLLLVNPCLVPFYTLPLLGYSVEGADRQFTEMFSKLSMTKKELTSTIVGLRDETVTTHHYTRSMFYNERYFEIEDGMHSGATLPLYTIINKHGKEIFGE